jgi:hypothetical protein
MPPNSIASGGQSRYAEFVAAQRGQVDTSLGQDSSRDQGRGPRGRRAQNQANKNGGPRRKPRETKESKVLRDLVFPTKPSTAPKPSAMEVQAKQQVDDLVTASKAGQLGEMMLRSQKDFPGVTNLKIIITDGAIESSNPSGPVLNRPAECIHVFHATREWLVDVTFYILSLGDGPLLQNKLEVMRSKVSPRYEATLFAVVVQAKKDVATKSYVALEPEYRRLGKLDVLEKAMELRHAEKATQNGKLLFQFDLNVQETDMTITAQPIDMVSNDPDVNYHDIQDTAAHVAPDSSSTAQPDAAEVATDTAAHVTAEGSSAAQPDAVKVATMDVPDTAELGTAELAFTIDGTDGEGRLTLDLPAGLEVDVHMTVNTNFSYLKNYEIFLDAFGSMVATLRLRIEAAKATDAVKVTEDAAVEAASSGSSGFGSDASFQIIRSPAMYSDDSDDSDDDSL